jgi:hypothetical protein
MQYETKIRKGKPITRQQYVPIATVAATYSKFVDLEEVLLPEEESTATFRDAYLLISNRIDAPLQVANAYAKHWRIEVFYRTAKQDLGLTSCFAQSENAHFAYVKHFLWQVKNKEDAEQAPTISEMVRYFFNANYRICCYQQHIQVYFDTTVQHYSSIFETFWTNTWDFHLWYWDSYTETV